MKVNRENQGVRKGKGEGGGGIRKSNRVGEYD
jgi:hypothetical protein